MDREIKFRGKSDLGVWKYGALNNVLNWADFIIEDWGGVGITTRVKSDTIGQFTGLQDKNGVDIYEGDIFHCNGVNYILKFLILGGAYTVHNLEDDTDERFLHHCNDKIEVIGNIHENPELKP